MGNIPIKMALDMRNYKIECGFYVWQESELTPIEVEWDPHTDDARTVHRYRWKFGKQSGEIVDHVPTSKPALFVDVLHALGMTEAQESDIQKGTIDVRHMQTRHMLVYGTPSAQVERVHFYVDKGMLQPVGIIPSRGIYKDADGKTYYKAFVTFRGKKRDLIDNYHTGDVDLFRTALKHLGFREFRLGQFRHGNIRVGDLVQEILVFRP
jgi:hypothetical protein